MAEVNKLAVTIPVIKANTKKKDNKENASLQSYKSYKKTSSNLDRSKSTNYLSNIINRNDLKTNDGKKQDSEPKKFFGISLKRSATLKNMTEQKNKDEKLSKNNNILQRKPVFKIYDDQPKTSVGQVKGKNVMATIELDELFKSMAKLDLNEKSCANHKKEKLIVEKGEMKKKIIGDDDGKKEKEINAHGNEDKLQVVDEGKEKDVNVDNQKENAENDDESSTSFDYDDIHSKYKKIKQFFTDKCRSLSTDNFNATKSTEVVNYKRQLLRRSSTQTFLYAKSKYESMIQKKLFHDKMAQLFMEKRNFIPLKPKRILEIQQESAFCEDKTPVDSKFFMRPALLKIKKAHSVGFNQIKQFDAINNATAAAAAAIFNLEEICMVYWKEIFIYFNKKDTTRRMMNQQFRRKNITPGHREILIQQILRICYQLNITAYIEYQAIKIFDDVVNTIEIPFGKLELCSLASLWIALKDHNIFYNIPLATKLVSAVNSNINKSDLAACERHILKNLNFEFSYSDPFTILNYNLLVYQQIQEKCIPQPELIKIYYFSSYLMEVSMFEEKLMNEPASLIAAVVSEIAMSCILEPEESLSPCSYKTWKLFYAFQLFSSKEYKECRYFILLRTIYSFHRGRNEHIIFKKYLQSKYGKLSWLLRKKIEKLLPE